MSEHAPSTDVRSTDVLVIGGGMAGLGRSPRAA